MRIYQHLIYYRITITERQSIYVIIHVLKFSKIPIEMDTITCSHCYIILRWRLIWRNQCLVRWNNLFWEYDNMNVLRSVWSTKQYAHLIIIIEIIYWTLPVLYIGITIASDRSVQHRKSVKPKLIIDICLWSTKTYV